MLVTKHPNVNVAIGIIICLKKLNMNYFCSQADLVNPLQDEEANDIWYTEEQIREMLTSLVKKNHPQRRRKRKVENFIIKPFRMWSLPIMYKFDGSHSESLLLINDYLINKILVKHLWI